MEPVISGAHVELSDLLALRHRPVPPDGPNNPRVFGSQSGLKVSRMRGRGVDFAEVRLYQPGDDVRSIDWRVTARKNKPHTKVFREERERPTLIVTDQSQSMFFGSRVRLKSVAAAEIASRIAWQTLAHNDRVGGVVLGNNHFAVYKPYRSIKAVARFLAEVARTNQALKRDTLWDSGAHLAEGLMRVRRLAHTNYRIFLLTDFQTELSMWRDALHGLARHNQVVAIHIYDQLERELPPADQYSVTDGTERFQFHTGSNRTRQKYRERFAAREEELQMMCAHDAIRYVALATDNLHLDAMSWV